MTDKNHDEESQCTIEVGTGVALDTSKVELKFADDKDRVIYTLMMAFEEIEVMDNMVKGDNGYFREEVRRIMNTTFQTLQTISPIK